MKKHYLALACSVALAGCIGPEGEEGFEGNEPLENNPVSVNDTPVSPSDESPDPSLGEPTLAGQFKDSATAGLDYTIEGTGYSGKTELDGSFKYFSDTDVITFSVGGVVIGSATVSDILTPIDLFEDGSSDKVDVKNIVSFLMSLDSDGNPDNGITISEEVSNQASSWAQVDFSKTDFEAEIEQQLGADVIVLPTSEEAKAHIESTYNCMYSGVWIGEFDYGDPNEPGGYFFQYTDPESGMRSGSTYSEYYPEFRFSTYSNPIQYRNEMALFSGSVNTGETFQGSYDSINSASGTWSWDGGGTGGSLSSSRFNTDLTFSHRYTALLTDSNESGYTNATNYYVAVDQNDDGDIKAIVYVYNEEPSGEYTVSARIAHKYEQYEKMNDGSIVISTNDTGKVVYVALGSASSTVTATLLDSDANPIDHQSTSYCEFN